MEVASVLLHGKETVDSHDIRKSLEMQNSHHLNRGNPSLSIQDFHWGKVEGPVKVGIWAAPIAIEPRKKVELRAAVHNVSNHLIELGHDFGLAVKHSEEIIEYFGGPRSSAAICLEPGEFREILGWSLDEESGIKASINHCWVIYRTESGEEIQSAVVEIEVRPCQTM